MNLTREPCAPPEVPPRVGGPRRQILFRHPGYHDSNNVLLKLFAPDSGPPSRGYGLYAGYALQACGIIAGNRWDGWLSEAKDHDPSTRVDSGSVLDKNSYYFHLPSPSSDGDAGRLDPPYPIVPTFREWLDSDFAAPEQSYATSNLTLALQARDVSCRITGCKEGTQVAHICPQKEAEWWYENDMSRYNLGSANTLDDLSNALLLRTDLHIAFDKPKFVFVPKPSSDMEKPRFVIHLVEASAELEFLYHNRALHPLYSSVETLFARFAWSIFPLLDAFLTCRERRRLLLANENAAPVDNDGFVAWDKCAQFSRKRSQSPKKRKPDSVPSVADNINLTTESGESRVRKKQLCQHLVPHENVHLSKTSASSTSTSPASLPALDAQASFELDDSDELEDLLVLSASCSTNRQDHAHFSALSRAWLAQERLRSNVHDQWKEKESWTRDVWMGKILLDEGEAIEWHKNCGAEFPEAEC
ncbi:hypothetical protein DM02DRAFT_706327 [Periconia macrospinosa]|uniref:HNH nuclease domain-containing protein n=1 Tax=Periconia macrospinosa TaxID=97972 RepID=A0A2V1CZL7_9PLEO|nr:hypothetical protein DM02DRAFT_706327 [Periconia macrospinosa]